MAADDAGPPFVGPQQAGQSFGSTDHAGPRLLLQRLRQIMEDHGDGQSRLNRIVKQIANLMIAEVCSIYLRRREGSLELFATEGLNADAVHKTHMKRGEGLIGLIAERAEPVNLKDAQAHPSFSYRPETGEEIYHSFMGVPIMRGGTVLGVLAIQNRTQRDYQSDEIEALQTVAMVLAEHIAAGEIDGIGATAIAEKPTQPVSLSALKLSEGVALGHVVLHEPRVAVTNLLSDNVGQERARLDVAINNLRESIDAMLSRVEISRAGEHRDVLETYRMFAHDRGWIEKLRAAVGTGLTAEAAVEAVQNKNRAELLRHSDPFWRERAHDLDDLSNRLLRLLSGAAATAAHEEIPEDTILIARAMGPAELFDYDQSRLRGLVIEDGGPTSHVAIVARALGIPALGQVGRIVDTVEPGDAAIIDAEEGEFHLRPTSDLVNAYSDKVRFRAKRQQQYEKLRQLPALTLDGQRVKLQINAGLMVDVEHLHDSGAEGIGLFRTELQFMVASSFPRREKQTAIYRSILDAVGNKPVVFRTVDIGGDKVLPYLRQAPEENPAMGWRAIRMSLDRPGLLRTQIRALLIAGGDRDMAIMVPMVTSLSEFRLVRDIVDREIETLDKFGHQTPSKVSLGAMFEVPSLLYQLDDLFEAVDFVSVGSNDLLQFFNAADRSNVRVDGRYNPLCPPPLRMLREIVHAARRYNKPLNLCGELAGRPLGAMALLGIGYRSISMAPSAVGPVKAMVRSLNLTALEVLMEELLEGPADLDIGRCLNDFAIANHVALPSFFDPDATEEEPEDKVAI